MPSRPRPLLVAIEGGAGASRGRLLSYGERAVVGRGEECDWRLADAAASHRHCALSHGEGGVRVEDLGSRHGTFLEGQRIAASMPLEPGQCLTLGGARLHLLGSVDDVPEWPGLRCRGILGEGALGRVYEAEVEGAAMAVKLTHADLSEREVARCRREARIHASLDHPGIVRCFGVREQAGRLAILTEVLEGRDLEGLGRDGPKAWRVAGAWMRAAAEALAFAHARGVAHRDIKPSNLFLTSDGRLRILDFGFAKRFRPEGPSFDLTSLGSAIGTYAYMAPEALTHGEAADGRADIFSLAASIVELISGEPAFPARSFPELLALRRAGARLESLQAPEALRALLLGALSFEREDRPSCDEAVGVLAALGL